MKFETAEIVGKDLHLVICVYPEVCKVEGISKHERATFGLGDSPGDKRTQDEKVASAIAEMTAQVNAKYAPTPTPKKEAIEGTTTGLVRLIAPVVPPFEVVGSGLPGIKQVKAEDGATSEVAVARFRLLHNGKPATEFTIQGATAGEFAANKAAATEAAKAKVLAAEADLAKAQAIVGS